MRLSLNQITTKGRSLPDAVQGCADAGIPAIGLWRDKVAEPASPRRRHGSATRAWRSAPCAGADSSPHPGPRAAAPPSPRTSRRWRRLPNSTLGQALDLAGRFPAEQVGVVVDSYHVWWDPDLAAQIARAGAGGRIASYQVCDWPLPLPADALLGRGHVGDGHIDFRAMTDQVTAAGYPGWIEVEIFNETVWETPGEQTLQTMIERHRAHVEAP